MTTENTTHATIELTNITSDWSYVANKPDKWAEDPRLLSIEFHPGAAGDIMVIKEEVDTGPERFYCEADSDIDSRIKYFHGRRCKPFIDYGECVLSSGHKLIIEQWGHER